MSEQVKLVSISKPEFATVRTAEEFVVYTARVSNPNNQSNMETAPKLINYLVKHKHWSPFEMVDACFEIKTSRAIAAQILRHRSFTFQEFSQRYSKATNFITYPARSQDLKNKQNSIDNLPEETKDWFAKVQAANNAVAAGIYEQAIEKGIAKEQARFLLPLSTKTTLYMKGSLRSWIHYIDVRTDVSTQKEHRDIAVAIKEELKKQFPSTALALEW